MRAYGVFEHTTPPKTSFSPFREKPNSPIATVSATRRTHEAPPLPICTRRPLLYSRAQVSTVRLANAAWEPACKHVQKGMKQCHKYNTGPSCNAQRVSARLRHDEFRCRCQSVDTISQRRGPEPIPKPMRLCHEYFQEFPIQSVVICRHHSVTNPNSSPPSKATSLP